MSTKETLFIVTGTTRGLGRDIFINLLEENHNILTINRSSFEHKNNIVFDFSEIEKLESKLFVELREKIKVYKTVAVILNAALIDPIKEIGAYSTNDAIKIINTNFISSVLIANFFVKEGKEGVIANISSGGIDFNFEGLGLYTSTKIATHKFFDIANIENTKMHFINFDPGTMDSQMTEKLRDDKNHFQKQSREYLLQKEKEKSFTSAQDSASRVLKLISEKMA